MVVIVKNIKSLKILVPYIMGLLHLVLVLYTDSECLIYILDMYTYLN